jgi:hypothetical protein
MSFASAKLTFISRSSCSILSNIWLDKSFSNSGANGQCTGWALNKQRRSSRNVVLDFHRPAAFCLFC